MAPPRRPWFRFYTEALTDPKLRRLSTEERWLWVAVLGAARKSPMPGWLMITESLAMEADDLAELAGMTAARVEKGLAKMVTLGIVVQDRNGTYRVTKWAERQFESDDSTKRTAKHRSRNDETPTMERPIDVPVAPPETDDREQRTETDPHIPDDDFTRSDGQGSSSSRDPDQAVWKAYAELVADDTEFSTTRAKFIAGVIPKVRRERTGRLQALKAADPSAPPSQLARWLYEDVDPVSVASIATDDLEPWEVA